MIGNGTKIIKQFPKNNTNVIKNDKVFLLTDGEEKKMPDVIGYSLSEIKLLAEMLNIDIQINGNGYVVQSNLLPGDIINDDTILKVDLKLPY